MFAGFFIPGLHENVSTRVDFTQDNLQSQHNIVPAKRECLHDKNCSAFAGIPLCRDGTKLVSANIFSIKRNVINMRYIHVWRDPVPPPHKQSL